MTGAESGSLNAGDGDAADLIEKKSFESVSEKGVMGVVGLMSLVDELSAVRKPVSRPEK